LRNSRETDAMTGKQRRQDSGGVQLVLLLCWSWLIWLTGQRGVRTEMCPTTAELPRRGPERLIPFVFICVYIWILDSSILTSLLCVDFVIPDSSISTWSPPTLRPIVMLRSTVVHHIRKGIAASSMNGLSM
jgi:hypothetical protein